MLSKWLGSFGVYAMLTVTLAGISVLHAFHTRKQFFPATIFLTTNKINVVVLSNVAFMMTLSLGKLVKYVFLGDLSAQEITEIERKGKIAVTETCLALTTFREELNVRMVALFTVLLFVKMFHWLAQMRIENVSVRTMGYGTHLRLSLLTVLLAISDVGWVTLITWGMLKQKGPSVLLLFAFEFMILTVLIITTAAKYLLFVHSRAAESPGGAATRCCHKHVWMFYLDFTADLLRLFLLLTFFMIICTYYGLPIHLIREIWVTFYGLRDRIFKFIQYRRLLRMLDHFPMAAPEELAEIRCTICLDSMQTGVKLPCSHIFHKHCLYTWLFNSQRCPNCVREIPTTLTTPPPPPRRGANQQPQPQPAAAAGGGARAEQPPLPAARRQAAAAAAAQEQAVPPTHIRMMADNSRERGGGGGGGGGPAAGVQPAAAPVPTAYWGQHHHHHPHHHHQQQQQQQHQFAAAAQSQTSMHMAQAATSRGAARPGQRRPDGKAPAAVAAAAAAVPPSVYATTVSPIGSIGFNPYMHLGYPMGVGGASALPTTGSTAASDIMLQVIQRHTLMLQQHVEFLQAQLSSTLGMLQQQLSLQEQILKAQTEVQTAPSCS